ncbi:MAG: ComEC/Rec2 family competence protein [Planctomycetes bacterium]|nr:ComEC/Rec2 family competence protein [Planctomycetota bacterium]
MTTHEASVRREPGALLEWIHRTAPLFPVAVGLIAGITVDEFVRPALWVYGVVFVAAAITGGLRTPRRRAGAVLLFIMAGGVGGVMHQNRVRRIAPTSIQRHATPERSLARVRGRIVGQPRIHDAEFDTNPFKHWTYGGSRTVFLFDVDTLVGDNRTVDVTGRLRVVVSEPVLDLATGERVEILGWLQALAPPANPGAFDWALFNRRKGIVGVLRLGYRENIRRLDSVDATGKAATVDGIGAGLIASFRATVRGLLLDDLSAGATEEASLLDAMLLGHRSQLDRRLNDIFVRAGCAHFLAVSGVHVVIVMMLVGLVCQALMVERVARTWIMIVVIVLYALLAEPRPPILRASIMALLYCAARLAGRDRAYMNWISAAVVLMATIEPAVVFDAGFQLSVVAVLGVAYLGPAVSAVIEAVYRWFARVVLHRPFDAEDRRQAQLHAAQMHGSSVVARVSFGVPRYLWRFVRFGLPIAGAAWLATLPLILLFFQRMYPWGAPNTIVVMPLVTFVMGLGFAKLILSVLAPPLGVWMGVVLTAVESGLIAFVDRLASMPGAAIDFEAPPMPVVIAYYALLAIVAWRFHGEPVSATSPEREAETPSAPRPRLPRGAIRAALAVFVTTVAIWLWPQGAHERLTVTILAVGNGSTTVIELPDGSTELYDAGSSRPYDIGASVIVPYLRKRGVRRIDRIFVSHPNLDHFSGIPTVLDTFSTGPVVINEWFEGLTRPRSPSAHLMELLRDRGHSIETMDKFPSVWERSGVRYERLWPNGARRPATRLAGGLSVAGELSPNDSSTVLRISYLGHSILLTGDIEERAQQALIERGGLGADVLVLPHHGGVRPSSRAFIDAVGASVLIRSSSRRRSETRNGLLELVGETTLLSTADVGAVEVTFDSEGVHVRGTRSAR